MVQIRWRPSADSNGAESEPDQQWADLAAPLFERATALGGRIIGWGDHFMSVDFSWDALYDAVDFLVDAPLFPELASGLCYGPVEVLYESPRMALAVGEALRRVGLLAQLARPGEILVDPPLVEATDGRLGSAGLAGKRPGRPEIPAVILDPERPLKDDPLAEIPPSVRSRSSRPQTPSEPSSSMELQPIEAEVRAVQVERLAGATEAVHRESDSTFPAALSSALKERSPESLKLLVQKASSGPQGTATERLSAMAQLVQGQGGEAIRRLREAQREAEKESPEVRCRAALALAVALAAVGRSQEAVLEGLKGLARAREAGDAKGERACARLLGNLASTLDDADSADAWNALCS